MGEQRQDEYRLPEGMQRTGYDADTGRYYFTDKDGSVWEGAAGAEFSEMRLVSEAPRQRENDIEAAPARADAYQRLAVDPPPRVSFQTSGGLASAYQTLFPFILLVAVLLLLAWRLLISPSFTAPPPCPGARTHWVQPGDTCWDLARTRGGGCGVDRLREMNPGLDCDRLMPGTTVCLPVVEVGEGARGR
ncbi:hypothetical protein DXG01_004839 [Tephrocybe rancida]|nr:hypothetical protein DXG01_004839 [Tephrocybe rancida]